MIFYKNMSIDDGSPLFNSHQNEDLIVNLIFLHFGIIVFLLCLKLFFNISWWWVFSPIWISLGSIIVVLILIIIAYLFDTCFRS
jgi:hypothetical protein